MVALALQRGDLEAAAVGGAERAMLEFARLLTENPSHTSDADVERLRNAGWNEEQIAEGVYIIALFAFFNRLADAFGLEEKGFRHILGLASRNEKPDEDLAAQSR